MITEDVLFSAKETILNSDLSNAIYVPLDFYDCCLFFSYVRKLYL